MNILQVSTYDRGGGASNVAWNLLQGYRARGMNSRMAVGYKRTEDPEVILIPNAAAANGWSRFWWNVDARLQSDVGRIKGAGWLSRRARDLAAPGRMLDSQRGVEDFRFPGTWSLLSPEQPFPEILHCHNLHGDYFDLRALPWLSQQTAVVLTLHDTWPLSGHCAYSMECNRWKTGCGSCPDLKRHPAVRRDATDFNWRRKKELYAQSRVHVATPSRWLMEQVEQSILAPAIVSARVIHNGVDLSVFHPGSKRQARERLGIPQEARVLVFVAYDIRRNKYKDFATVRVAARLAAEQLPDVHLQLYEIGEGLPSEQFGSAEIRYVPPRSQQEVVDYYRAADLYLHAARADTFPTVVLEALACGTPVMATAVGGIPEQVRGLPITNLQMPTGDSELRDVDATGVLVPMGDAEGMAKAIVSLLQNEPLRLHLGENAVVDARQRFHLQRQVDDYLNWYQEILTDRSSASNPNEA